MDNSLLHIFHFFLPCIFSCSLSIFLLFFLPFSLSFVFLFFLGMRNCAIEFISVMQVIFPQRIDNAIFNHQSAGKSINLNLFDICYLLFAICYLLFAICYLLFSIFYFLFSIFYLLFAICYLRQNICKYFLGNRAGYGLQKRKSLADSLLKQPKQKIVRLIEMGCQPKLAAPPVNPGVKFYPGLQTQREQGYMFA